MPTSLNVHRIVSLEARARKHNASVWLSIIATNSSGDETIDITFFIDGEGDRALKFAETVAASINSVNQLNEAEVECIES